MRIALISQTFAPEIGGLATISRTLAEALQAEGHEVEIFTRTSDSKTTSPYPVHRGLGIGAGRAKIRKCDAIVQNHPSLWGIAMHLLTLRPCAVWLQAPLEKGDCWRNVLISFLFRCYVRFNSRVVAISSYTLKGLPPKPVIGNAYNTKLFFSAAVPPRAHSVLFCGRLIKTKGVHLLLEAAHILQTEFPDLRLIIAGHGPDEAQFRDLAVSLGLSARTDFCGALAPEQIAKLMRESRVLAIPSIWNEPFGVVALEGIASGSYVVAFPDAGLRDAVGDAGLLCEEKSPESLARNIRRVFVEPTLCAQIDHRRQQHLDKFQPRRFARIFIDLLFPPSQAAPACPGNDFRPTT